MVVSVFYTTFASDFKKVLSLVAFLRPDPLNEFRPKASSILPDCPHRSLTVRRQKQLTTMKKQQIIKIIISVLIAALTALGTAFGLTSCNVVRTITNKSEYYQRGDTSVMIQTKTVESYDASKR